MKIGIQTKERISKRMRMSYENKEMFGVILKTWTTKRRNVLKYVWFSKKRGGKIEGKSIKLLFCLVLYTKIEGKILNNYAI